MKIFGGVEADHAAGSGAAGSTGSLRCGSLADALDVKRRDSSPGRVRGDASQAAIDHRGDAFDGHGAFGDVGRENHFALAEGATARSCSAGERSPCKGSTSSEARAAIFSMARDALRISAAPGRKTRTSPGKRVGEQTLQRRRHLIVERRGGVRGVLDGESMQFARGAEDRAIPKEAGNGCGIEGRGHDDQLQVVVCAMLAGA